MNSSKPLFGILGIYIPMSVLVLWSVLFGQVYRFYAERPFPFSHHEGLWWIIALSTAIIASLYVTLVKRIPFQHGAGDFRGGIFLVAIAYMFASILQSDLPLGSRFWPVISSVGSALAALFSWASVIYIRDTFTGLALFNSLTSNYEGEQLKHHMREMAPEMIQTSEKLTGLMKTYGIQFIPPCLLMSAPGISQNSMSMAVLVFFLFSGGFLFLGYLSFERRMMTHASEGLSLTLRDRALPLLTMALGIGAAALLSLAASSDRNILPFEIFLAILAWLGSLIQGRLGSDEPRTGEEFSFPYQMSEMASPITAELLEDQVQWGGWVYVRYGVLALAALLFLYFMVHPLLKRWGFFVNPKIMLQAILNWFKEIKNSIMALIAALKEQGGGQKLLDPNKLNKIRSELLGGLKQKNIERSVGLFARLILWGIESLQVPWRPSFPPGEYCKLLAERANPSVGADILLSGQLFEKALYSSQTLSAGEERQFRQSIQKITRSEAP